MRKRDRSCLCKRRYSEREADEVIATRKSLFQLYKYYCTYCKFWHLTKRPQD